MNKPKILGVGKPKIKSKSKNHFPGYKRRYDEVLAIKLLSGGCAYCGWNIHPEVLQFHHRKPLEKENQVSRLVNDGRPMDEILKEIEKCDIICPNCHTFKHYRESKK
jgi:hypothetical protein